MRQNRLGRAASENILPLSPLEATDSFHSPCTEGRASTSGRGLFATTDIEPGSVVAVFGGSVVSGAELALMPPGSRPLVVQIGEDAYLLTRTEGPGDWVNHSCEPNTGLIGQIMLVAMKPIPCGTEVTYDYAMSDGSAYDEFACACGSRLCRGRVTGQDWQRPELIARYRGYFSPYLQRRIDERAQESAHFISDEPDLAPSGWGSDELDSEEFAPTQWAPGHVKQ